MPAQLFYGSSPVPYTVSWTGEESTFVGPCRHASGRLAICQVESRGHGKPIFGTPHSNRQREAIAGGLCDLCGLSLKNRTKVSLSHARPQANGATGLNILQVEPLLHRECAKVCIEHCPSLKKDIGLGMLMVRQVSRYRVQFAIIGNEFIPQYVPGYEPDPREVITGHAKVELVEWRDRNLAWIKR